MGRHLGVCPECDCEATIDDKDNGVCIWCAPKEERMQFENRCRKCERGFIANVNNARMCPECKKDHDGTLRAVYDRAFWAGIANDLCMEFAHRDALVIVRNWPAMQAELDALIREMAP